MFLCTWICMRCVIRWAASMTFWNQALGRWYGHGTSINSAWRTSCHTCWGKYGSNISTFLKPFFPFYILRVWHRAVLEMRLWVFHSCMTKSISKDFVLVFEDTRICETSSAVVFLRSMFGWCSWPRNGELQYNSTWQTRPWLLWVQWDFYIYGPPRKVSKSPVINQFHPYPYFCSLSTRWLIFCLLCQFAGTWWLAPLCATEALQCGRTWQWSTNPFGVQR